MQPSRHLRKCKTHGISAPGSKELSLETCCVPEVFVYYYYFLNSRFLVTCLLEMKSSIFPFLPMLPLFHALLLPLGSGRWTSLTVFPLGCPFSMPQVQVQWRRDFGFVHSSTSLLERGLAPHKHRIKSLAIEGILMQGPDPLNSRRQWVRLGAAWSVRDRERQRDTGTQRQSE